MINSVTCYYDSSDLSNHFEIQGIKSFRFHSQFGAEGPLKFGGAYASSIEFEYYINSQRDLNTGDALVHYQKFERSQTDFHLLPEGTYRTIFNNVFYVYSFEKNKNVARVVAYDAIKFLDIDYSKRLSSIESSFPMTVYDLLQDIFSYSGCNVSLPLFNPVLKNTPVDYFYVEKITARTIASCIAELNGNNLLASTEDNAPFTPKISFSVYSGYEGQIIGYPEYMRYGAKNYIIAPTDQDTYIVDNVQLIPAFYKENSLEVGTDEYKEIDCVKAIKLNGDVVASYGNTENNIYYVRNNVIVENVSSMANNAIATLYNEARLIDATPAVKVDLFPFRCPFVISGITYFVDTDGSIKKLPIMSIDWTESRVIVQSFGTSVQDYSEYSYQNVEEQNTSIVSVLNKLESDLNDKVSKSGDTMTGALNLDVPLAIASGGTGSSTKNFVDLSTAQTVGGTKTFTANPVVSDTSPGVIAKNTARDDTVAPSSDYNSVGFRLRDKDDANIAIYTDWWGSDGKQGARIIGYRNGVSNALNLLVDANGDRQIAISEATPWRKALGLGTNGAFPITIAQGGTGSTTKNFVDLSNEQTIGGHKIFTSWVMIDRSASAVGTGNLLNILAFKYKNPQGYAKEAQVIRTYGDTETAANNAIVILGSNSGTTILGAGESIEPVIDANQSISNTENIYLIADGSINLWTGGNQSTGAVSKAVTIANNGNVTLLNPLAIGSGGTGQNGLVGLAGFATAGSNFAVTSATGYQWGKMVQVDVAVKCTTAVTVTTGTTMFTINNAALRPVLDINCPDSVNNRTLWRTNGNVQTFKTIAVNTTLSFRACYLVP